MITTVYLASAIDQSGAPSSLYQATLEILHQLQLLVYNPRSSFSKVTYVQNDSLVEATHAIEAAHFVYSVNQCALETANLRLFLVEDLPSWGIPMELQHTVTAGLPFILLHNSNNPALPMYLLHLLNQADAYVADNDPQTELARVGNLLTRVGSEISSWNHPTIWISEGD